MVFAVKKALNGPFSILILLILLNVKLDALFFDVLMYIGTISHTNSFTLYPFNRYELKLLVWLIVPLYIKTSKNSAYNLTLIHTQRFSLYPFNRYKLKLLVWLIVLVYLKSSITIAYNFTLSRIDSSNLYRHIYLNRTSLL